MIDVFRHDLRYALRSLRHRPGFTALTAKSNELEKRAGGSS